MWHSPNKLTNDIGGCISGMYLLSNAMIARSDVGVLSHMQLFQWTFCGSVWKSYMYWSSPGCKNFCSQTLASLRTLERPQGDHRQGRYGTSYVQAAMERNSKSWRKHGSWTHLYFENVPGAWMEWQIQQLASPMWELYLPVSPGG